MTAPTNLWAVKLGAILGIAICRDDLPESADYVEKLFFGRSSQFCGPVEAAVQKRCGGPVGLTKNPLKTTAPISRRHRMRRVVRHRIWREF
jgi:hypothetical protein